MHAVMPLRIASWTPWVVLAAIGVVDGVGTAGSMPWLAWAASAGAAFGLVGGAIAWAARRDPALDARRTALLASGGAVVIGAALALAALWGARDGHARAEEMARGRATARRAVEDLAGWSGGLVGDGFRIFITHIPAASEHGREMAAGFDRPFSLLVVSVDNRAGARPVEVDLGVPQLLLADGGLRPGPPRGEFVASVRSLPDEFRRLHGGPYRVQPGEAMGSGLLFLAPGDPLEQTVALSLLVNGAPVAIPGRWFSAEEKRALRSGRPGAQAQP
ncbi:MAG: hypothetical protein EXR72_13475 [Myxococcales bacterium]|nr:hypothetical protein [Myxococcales bacterium]